MTPFPTERPRRLRRSENLRRQVAETRLHPAMFVLPVFVLNGENIRNEISSMPGNFQLSVDQLIPLAKEAESLGIGGILLFGIPETKDETGASAWDVDGPVCRAIGALKEHVPNLVVWADVCMCEYTSHGHCGIVKDGVVDNDSTLPLLAKTAVAYATAGADIIAPSDMMDGRVNAIRTALDEAGSSDVAICSYAVKYSSAYYGPFREAADSAPAFGDRRTHQMNPANVREALREVALDVAEGADMVMVKPAGAYQDVIAAVRQRVDIPVAAYQVSGEYSMIKAAGERGWIDEERVMMESLIGIARSGADIVVTYFALEASRHLGAAR